MTETARVDVPVDWIFWGDRRYKPRNLLIREARHALRHSYGTDPKIKGKFFDTREPTAIRIASDGQHFIVYFPEAAESDITRRQAEFAELRQAIRGALAR